jgi:hypothetical protein
MVTELSLELLKEHIGETFLVSRPEASDVELRLVQASDAQSRFKKQSIGPKLETFALIFEGSVSQPLSQSMFQFTNANLGTMDLFLTPIVSSKPEVRAYEVTISRMIGA